jgi:WD40 repeat protein
MDAYSTALSPDGRYVAAGGMDGCLRIWDFHSGQLLKKWNAADLGFGCRLFCVVFTQDGKGLLTAEEAHAVKLWDVSSLMASQSATAVNEGGTVDFTFRGHMVCEYYVWFCLELIFPLVGQCPFCFHHT